MAIDRTGAPPPSSHDLPTGHYTVRQDESLWSIAVKQVQAAKADGQKHVPTVAQEWVKLEQDNPQLRRGANDYNLIYAKTDKVTIPDDAIDHKPGNSQPPPRTQPGGAKRPKPTTLQGITTAAGKPGATPQSLVPLINSYVGNDTSPNAGSRFDQLFQYSLGASKKTGSVVQQAMLEAFAGTVNHATASDGGSPQLVAYVAGYLRAAERAAQGPETVRTLNQYNWEHQSNALNVLSQAERELGLG